MSNQDLRRDDAAVIRPAIAFSEVAVGQGAAVVVALILLLGAGLVAPSARHDPPGQDQQTTTGTVLTYDVLAWVTGRNGGLRRHRQGEPPRTTDRRRPAAPSAPPRGGRVAVVTGGSQGLGLQIVRMLASRGMRVVLACQSAARGRAAVDLLGDLADRVAVRELDITDPASVQRLVTWLDRRLGRCDVLVNAAGPADEAAVVDSRVAMEANLLGVWRLTQALAPLMRLHRYGRVVNMSSGLPRRRVAKRTVKMLTRILAKEFASDGILVNACCPSRTPCRFQLCRSYVPTDTPVRLATLPEGGPTGRCYC